MFLFLFSHNFQLLNDEFAFLFAGDEISMSSQAVFSLSGEDALITCMVRPEDSSSSASTRAQKSPGVIWAKLKSSDTPVARRDDAPREILTADTTRVTADRRFNVIRDEGELVSFYFFF